MTNENSLHQLVLSLDGTEKRLFKTYLNNKKSILLTLFDVLASMKIYDKKIFLQKLGNSSLRNNLNQHKNTLKEELLYSLRKPYSSSPKEQLDILLKNYQVLIDKLLLISY
jgi:hypothetical protein